MTHQENTSKTGVVAAVAIGLAGITAPLSGGLMRTMALDPQHRALGQQFLVGCNNPLNLGGGAAGALLVEVPSLGGTSYASMTIISPSWGLTAMHVIDPLLPYGPLNISVRTGRNFDSDPGTSVTVDQYIPIPGGASGDPSRPDLCLIHFSEPIVGVMPATFGTYGTGDVLTAVGYGRYGSPDAGEFPRDGNVRAGRGTALSHPDSFNEAFYGALAVGSQNDQNIPQAGRTLGGDSGAPVFNANGEIVGINVQGTNGVEWNGASYFVRLDRPEIANWIAEVTGVGRSCPVDFNRDGFIDFFDYDEMVICLEGNCGPGRSPDFNKDGFIDFFDYSDYVVAFEQGCQ